MDMRCDVWIGCILFAFGCGFCSNINILFHKAFFFLILPSPPPPPPPSVLFIHSFMDEIRVLPTILRSLFFTRQLNNGPMYDVGPRFK